MFFEKRTVYFRPFRAKEPQSFTKRFSPKSATFSRTKACVGDERAIAHKSKQKKASASLSNNKKKERPGTARESARKGRCAARESKRKSARKHARKQNASRQPSEKAIKAAWDACEIERNVSYSGGHTQQREPLAQGMRVIKPSPYIEGSPRLVLVCHQTLDQHDRLIEASHLIHSGLRMQFPSRAKRSRPPYIGIPHYSDRLIGGPSLL